MIYLIDASVFIFRAYYTIPPDMQAPDGTPINALYGFCRFLGDVLEKQKPEYIAVAFDESLSTSFRNEIYPDYKANRDPAPEDLKVQFALCRQAAALMGTSVHSSPRYEADDIIGKLSVFMRDEGVPSTIVSRDKDLTQLIKPGDKFWDLKKAPLEYSEIKEYFGVHPEAIADFLALTGDTVDNIPGIPGVGKKTAAALLENFTDLDDIYANIPTVSTIKVRGAKTLGAKLLEHKELVYRSRELTEIAIDMPMDVCEDELKWKGPKLDKLNSFFDDLGIGQGLRNQVKRL
jgi:5'-3' exonuclease